MSAEKDSPADLSTPGKWRWPFGPVRTLLIVSATLSAFFLLFSSLDIWFSRLFYNAEFGFPATLVPVFNWMRGLANALVWAIGIALIASVAVKLTWPLRSSLISPRTSLFLGSTLLIGPGLLVNGILKTAWGRPRPTEIVEFGGDLPFVEVWRITDYCSSNCSFVSGEASTAVWLMALVLVVPLAWRNRVAVVALILAVIFSLNRVAFGGHFVSDVLISWSLTLLIVAIAHHYLFLQPFPGFAEEELEAKLTRAGLAIRRIGGRPGAGAEEGTSAERETPESEPPSVSADE